jgi:uncharacterized protein YndB with AHSA1/START domain
MRVPQVFRAWADSSKVSGWVMLFRTASVSLALDHERAGGSRSRRA